jgi:hypothetical protein
VGHRRGPGAPGRRDCRGVQFQRRPGATSRWPERELEVTNAWSCWNRRAGTVSTVSRSPPLASRNASSGVIGHTSKRGGDSALHSKSTPATPFCPEASPNYSVFAGAVVVVRAHTPITPMVPVSNEIARQHIREGSARIAHAPGTTAALSSGDGDVGGIWQFTAWTWQQPLDFNFGRWNRLVEEEQPTWQSSHSSRPQSNTSSSGRRIQRTRRYCSSTASWSTGDCGARSPKDWHAAASDASCRLGPGLTHHPGQ